MHRRSAVLAALLLVLGLSLAARPVAAARPAAAPAAATPIQVYGSWHCGNDACTWATVRDMTDFDTKNHWIIDRGDGSGKPPVNLLLLGLGIPPRQHNKPPDSDHANGGPTAFPSFHRDRGWCFGNPSSCS